MGALSASFHYEFDVFCMCMKCSIRNIIKNHIWLTSFVLFLIIQFYQTIRSCVDDVCDHE